MDKGKGKGEERRQNFQKRVQCLGKSYIVTVVMPARLTTLFGWIIYGKISHYPHGNMCKRYWIGVSKHQTMSLVALGLLD